MSYFEIIVCGLLYITEFYFYWLSQVTLHNGGCAMNGDGIMNGDKSDRQWYHGSLACWSSGPLKHARENHQLSISQAG